MTIRDLAREMPGRIEAPICIVGAGMVGLVLAQRLAARGRRVVVLESGGAGFDEAVHALNAIEDVTGRYTRAMTGHYRGLGGSSTRWGGRMVPISPHETGERPHLGLHAWPLPTSALDRYDREIEKLFQVDDSPFDEEVLPLIDRIGAFQADDPDFNCRWAKWPHLRRCNLGTLLREQLRGDANIEIWLNATVTGFDLDTARGRLKGLRAGNLAGGAMTVSADEIVLAAGTIETTRLLLWLDEQSGGKALPRGRAVLGRYLQDHINVEAALISRAEPDWSNQAFAYHFLNGTRRSLHLQSTVAAQEEDEAASGFAYVSADWRGTPLDKIKSLARGGQRGQIDLREALGLTRNIGLVGKTAYWRYMRRQFYVPANVVLKLEICIEQMPHRDNTITLSQRRDALGLPMARLRWQPNAADERTLRSMVRRLDAYWRRQELDRHAPLAWSPACADPHGMISAEAVDYAHPSGTARMGADARDSVVGPDLACHDLGNLRVASAAVFPHAGSANPTFTLLRMAMWLGDTMETRQRVATPVAVPESLLATGA